jgi:subtilisin family serine protease
VSVRARWALIGILVCGTAAAAGESAGAPAPSEPYPDRWWAEHIGLDPSSAAADVFTQRCAAPQPVTVAVIDTGVDYTHPDLPRTQLWVNDGEKLNGLDNDHDGYVGDLIGWNFVDGDNNPWDDAGHGTLVAGLIAAAPGGRSPGINPQARIMALKVLNAAGFGRSSDLAAAVDFATAHGARVINLSLGDAELGEVGARAVRRAIDAGVLVVVAAGNQARDTRGFGLADLDGVLTVAATDRDDRRARFANWGRSVHIAAPGVDILGLRARGTDLIATSGAVGYRPGTAIVGTEGRYYRASGTSFAAAIVAGSASLLLSCRPKLTGVEAGRLLVQAARELEPKGVNLQTGYGLLDVRAALAGDEQFWVEAQIDAVALGGSIEAPTIVVTGTADASSFGGARLRAAPESYPNDWLEVGAPLASAVHAGKLAEFDARTLRGPSRWILELVTTCGDGRARAARYALDLRATP